MTTTRTPRSEISHNLSRALKVVGTPLGLIAIPAVLLAFAPLAWLPFLVGAPIAFLLLVRHPWLIWAALGALLPWTSGIRLSGFSVTDLIVAAAVLLWFADAVRRGRVRLHISRPALAATVYIAVLYLASFNATDIHAAAVQMVKWIQFVLILVLLPTMVDGDRHAPWLVSGLFLGAASQAFLGLYQFYFRVGPDWFIIQDQYMRASGTFGQPNPFGGYMGLTLPVALSVLSWLSLRPLRKRRLHWGDIAGWTLVRGLGIVLTAGLLVSWSRGAWIGGLIAAAIVLWLSGSRIVRILSVVAILTLFILGAVAPLLQMIPAEFIERFTQIPTELGLGASLDTEVTDENFAILERLAFWLAALSMWESSPWLGIGPGNYDRAYALFGPARWALSLGHAHNIYLNTLAESGIAGLIAFLWLWGSVVRLALQRYRAARGRDPWQAALAVGVLGVVAHLAVHSFFDNLFVQGMFLHLSLWIAILLCLQPTSQRVTSGNGENPTIV